MITILNYRSVENVGAYEPSVKDSHAKFVRTILSNNQIYMCMLMVPVLIKFMRLPWTTLDPKFLKLVELRKAGQAAILFK